MRADILVVDDSLTNLQFLVAILNGKGYKRRVVCDGVGALKSARLRASDLILLDVEMPGIDGYEVCKQLKTDERTRHIPVIFISAWDEDPTERAKVSAGGGVDYIIKPFRIDDVLARVEANLA